MLDEDLAKIYGVETRILNQAIRRNMKRFPDNFMFQLSEKEFQSLISQIVISKRGGRRKKPFVFTEHGAVMLAGVLRSDRAIQMSIEVVKSFVELRRAISSQEDILKQLAEVRTYMLQHSNETRSEIRKIWKTLDGLTNPINKRIGFEIEESE